MPTSIFFLWHQETCCICSLNAISYYKSILWYIYYQPYTTLPSRVFKMDQFSKVADGVALFLAVGRPGAKFQACFALLSSPHHVSGKRCKTYFSQKHRRILPTCCV